MAKRKGQKKAKRGNGSTDACHQNKENSSACACCSGNGKDEESPVNPNLEEINTKSDNIKCIFCDRCDVDEAQYGKLYKLKTKMDTKKYGVDDVIAHLFCLLFSNGMRQDGADHEGIEGHLAKDILKEYQRGKKLKCKFCKKPRATIGCNIKECKHSFHFTCGSDNGTLQLFHSEFASYCPAHKASKIHPLDSYLPERPWGPCEICNDPCDGRTPVLCPPCCKEKVYHKLCLQKTACSSGACTRCPNNCIDQITFQDFLRRMGVHVPFRDNSWQTKEELEELNTLEYSCDVEVCLCPKGRTHCDCKDPTWRIIRCGSCGFDGTHMRCSNLEIKAWECPGCVRPPKEPPAVAPIADQSFVDSSNKLVQEVQNNVKERYERSDFMDFRPAEPSPAPAPIATTLSNSREQVVYDRELKKRFRVFPPAPDPDSDSDDEVVPPVTIRSLEPLHPVGPITARKTSATATQIAAVTSTCIPSIRQSIIDEATGNEKSSVVPVNPKTSKDADPTSGDPISPSSPTLSEDLTDVWTELPSTRSDRSPSTRDSPGVLRKRKSEPDSANLAQKRNRQVRDVDTDSPLDEDCSDEGRSGTSGKRNEPNDEIYIVKDTRQLNNRVTVKVKKILLVDLEKDGDDSDNSSL